jgi:hypothetical protein
MKASHRRGNERLSQTRSVSRERAAPFAHQRQDARRGLDLVRRQPDLSLIGRDR